jgi:beta-galactosidase
MSPKFYVGYGWYRKHFTVPATWSGKSVFLEFQAAFDQAQIYVNGKQVGEHLGGYNGFSVDVTSAIKTGDNVVAVRLNNNWNAQLPPITGDHTFQGGIYRDVFIVVTDPLRIAWYGTWVTTPSLATNAGSSSTVEIKTEVQNNRATTVSATLKTDIVDEDGKVVATVSSQQQIEAGKTVTFDQTTPAISNPALWHPDHPTLYQALSYLSDGAGTVDEFATTFGFRWLSWSAKEGFSLNGAHYWIQGGNVHQDHAGWGSGITDAAFHRDVKMVKDAGMNFIRGSHYPKAPAFADACDELGILLWSETQDAWLLVTVVDASGKPISNNVPVTLTIKSGPGEFPTGPSITFTPSGSGSASDIAILDGQAAIEFRTYYSGTTAIEATSSGLTSSSVTITSQGEPAWVEGSSPKVESRPYKP